MGHKTLAFSLSSNKNAQRFKSISKQRKISFSSVLHNAKVAMGGLFALAGAESSQNLPAVKAAVGAMFSVLRSKRRCLAVEGNLPRSECASGVVSPSARLYSNFFRFS